MNNISWLNTSKKRPNTFYAQLNNPNYLISHKPATPGSFSWDVLLLLHLSMAPDKAISAAHEALFRCSAAASPLDVDMPRHMKVSPLVFEKQIELYEIWSQFSLYFWLLVMNVFNCVFFYFCALTYIWYK